MANEVHIWQSSDGDALAAASWDTADRPAVQAVGVGTFTGVPANNDTIRINGTDDHTYTWKTTLTGAADEVKIGGDLATSRTNLQEAINASPAGNAGVTYGTGTVAHVDVTAADTSTDQITITSIKFGTTQNSIAITDPIDTGTVFSWDNATLTGGLTNWATGGTVEIIFDENNHHAMTSNLDWSLFLPKIPILRVTKKILNHTAIGSAGSFWKIDTTVGLDTVINLQGTGDCHIDFNSGLPRIIQDGIFKLFAEGSVKMLFGVSGACDLLADLGSGVGGQGSFVASIGSGYVLNILNNTLKPAGMLIGVDGTVLNERDIVLGNWIINFKAKITNTGKMDGDDDGMISFGGTFIGKPRAANTLKTSLYMLGGLVDFGDSEFKVLVENSIIGRKAKFIPGRVDDVVGSTLDLRDPYP